MRMLAVLVFVVHWASSASRLGGAFGMAACYVFEGWA